MEDGVILVSVVYRFTFVIKFITNFFADYEH